MDIFCNLKYVRNFAGIGVLLYLLKLYIRKAKFTKVTKITDKVAIIIGANTGIGFETAIDLAKREGKVYIACRDIKRGQDALEKIRSKSGSDRVYFLQLDLASMASIHQFSDKFRKLENKLDILVNNAGVMACPKAYTSDGFDMQMGVNHLGHFLLTHLLLDLLKASESSRIVNVSSEGHKISNIDKNDLMSEKNYSAFKAYSRSKLANILFGLELSKRLRGTNVTVNSCHPGVVETELQRHMNKYLYPIFIRIFRPFMKTPWEGAQTQICLAVDPELEGVTGKYFKDCKEATPNKHARDDYLAKWLYDESLKYSDTIL